MYLSRVSLALACPLVRRDMSDCHAMHRTIMSAFPQAPPHQDARAVFAVLYRLETFRGAELLVQSLLEPEWRHLDPSYFESGGAQGQNPVSKRIDEQYSSLREDLALTFRLRANPTRKIGTVSGPNGEHRNGRRVPLFGEAVQLDWLERKAMLGGFSLARVEVGSPVPDIRDIQDPRVTGRKGARGQGSRLTFNPVTFEGRLQITDAGLFRETLHRGIGPGKAYGFGLLSIAPA